MNELEFIDSKMNRERERQRRRYLNNYFSNEIIELFAAGIPKEDQGIIENKISCAEAVEVLRHTMGQIESQVPLDFNSQLRF